MQRRLFLGRVVKSALLLPLIRLEGSGMESNSSFPDNLVFDKALKPFYYGVASGDPQANQVVIWTKILPENSPHRIEVTYEVATDNTFNTIIKKGSCTAFIEDAYTINLVIDRLEPDSYYFYRFNALGKTSIIGRTKTAALHGNNDVRFAMITCSNYELGYFNVYARIAEMTDIDAVVHLGDYIYEYGSDYTYHNGKRIPERAHHPAHDIVSLDDYRLRYAQYHLDKDLMKARQLHPFITMWDDHEFANDSWATGAQNHHSETQGDYQIRKHNAIKAYFEWMPITNFREKKVYRKFRYGDIVELFLIDGRSERDAPVKTEGDPLWRSEERKYMSDEQAKWLVSGINSSKAAWKILGNNTMFSYENDRPFHIHDNIITNENLNMDSWNGYPATRQRIVDNLINNKTNNFIIVTGDTHKSWAMEAICSMDDTTPFAVELGTPAMCSGLYTASKDVIEEIPKELMNPKLNPHLKYEDITHYGFMVLHLLENKATANWYFVETVSERSNQVALHKTFTIEKNTHQLQEI